MNDAVERTYRKPPGWIGVDLDATIAYYDSWRGAEHIGEPIPDMLFRVKKWIAEGREVRILTARAFPYLLVPVGVHVSDCAIMTGVEIPKERVLESAGAVRAIRDWCKKHLGQHLTITCVKDYSMIELWDDRAVQVEPNTGVVLGRSTRGLS